MRSLGLDVGDRRIGVAISDPDGILASPLTIIERQDESSDIETIVRIVSEHQIKMVVVGLPRSMDGTTGIQANKVQAFVDKLGQRLDIPIEFRDERLTTVSAKRLMRSVNTKKTRKKVRPDAIAAALILQSYLDERSTPCISQELA